MRAFAYILLLSLIVIGCEKNSALLENISEKVRLYTDAPSYHEKDSINLFLENNSSFDIITGMRCGQYLEMGYQINEKNKWSDEKYFWYMQHRCLTFPDTIHANSTFSYSFPATLFDTTGTFRLTLPYYIPEKDSGMVAVSNSFEIF